MENISRLNFPIKNQFVKLNLKQAASIRQKNTPKTTPHRKIFKRHGKHILRRKKKAV